MTEERQTGNYVVKQFSFDWLDGQIDILEKLVAEQPEPTPFQTQDWLASWWRSFGAGYDAFVLAVFLNDNIISVWPLMRRKASLIRELEWIGAGRSDHAPLLIKPGHEHEVLECVAAYLQQSSIGWDILSLRTIRERDQARLSEAMATRLLFAKEDVSPRVDISGTWDQYLETKSRKHRGNILRSIKKLESRADVTVACETDFCASLLQEIADVEANSWKRTDGSLRMNAAGYRFFECLLRQFSIRRWLEVWVLRYQGRMLSYLVTFRYGEGIYYYNGAYRADTKECLPDIAVGSTLLSLAVRSAHDRHMRSFDFLRGDEPYKDLWVTSKPQLHHMVMRRRSLRGILGEAVGVRLRWWARQSTTAQRLWGHLATMRSRFSAWRL